MLETKARSYRLGSARGGSEQRDAIRQVKDLTRHRFTLDEQIVIFVAETTCARSDCPPLQTVVVFWTEDGTRQHFKMFKSVKDIVIDDLPPAWLMDALASFERDGRACC